MSIQVEVETRKDDDSPGAPTHGHAAFVALKTADGRYVRGDAGPVALTPDDADRFVLIEWDADRAALWSLAAGRYLRADAQHGVAAAGTEIGAAETFRLSRDRSGGVAFQLTGGAYLSAPAAAAVLRADARDAGAAESFTLERHEELEAIREEAHCCCGMGPARKPSIAWNDETHSKIVSTALAGMRALPKLPRGAYVALQFHDSDVSRDQLRKGLTDGLKAADYESPYAGDWVPGIDVFTYHPHFYNPYSGKNYRGNHLRGDTTAMSEGRRYFNLSVQLARRVLKRWDDDPGWPAKHPALFYQAGRYLGLSLHFLTDINQPMHAANFTNFYGEEGRYPLTFDAGDKRHTNFEDYVEKCVHDGYFESYNEVRESDLAVGHIPHAADFLHAVAIDQHRTFKEHVERVAHGMKGGAAWKKSDVTPIIERSLKVAPRNAATLLSFWGHCVSQHLPIDPLRWYLIRLNNEERISLQDGYYWRTRDTGDNALFAFLFNADGTCTPITKAYKANPWFEFAPAGTTFISEYKNGSGSPVARSRFRVGRESVGSYWFYGSADEVVTAATPGARLTLAPPVQPRDQVFVLEDVGPISQQDQAAIYDIWRDCKGMQWWGKKDE